MAYVFFNEDPNHFLFTRWKADQRTVTRAQAEAFVDQYRDTGVTDFFVCLNASSNWYRSVNTQNVLDKHLQWKAAGKLQENSSDTLDIVAAIPAMLLDFIRQEGVDIQQVWIDRLRTNGIRPWISFRMNDIHNGAEPGAFLHSDFYDANISTCNRASHRKPAGHFEYALDYMKPEVRAHYKEVIREGLMHFDADGVEFDWMREAYSVQIGREAEALEVLSRFMEELFGVISEAEAKWGHPIRIAVRVPDSPEKCLRMGLDVFRWLDSGRIHLLTVSPRWSSSDHDLPMDVWRRIIGKRPILLAAGLEILLDAYNRPGRKYWTNTLETALGLTYGYLCQDVDGIYLFNYMDACVQEEDYFCSNPEQYRRFLQLAGNRDSQAGCRRRHVVTYNDVSAPGATRRKPLPMTLRAGAYNTLRIPVGTLLPGQNARLVIGLERGMDTAPTALEVYVNGCPCPLQGDTAGEFPAYDDMDYIAFALPEACRTHPILVAEIGMTQGQGRVHWAEIQVDAR